MQIHLISGFLGSGKTTAIQTACKVLLDKDYKIGVITNDQGIRLVDTGLFESLSVPNRQVINGCFCCNYNSLDDNIQSLIETNNPDIVFAESVGSCTDIIATVMKPLLKFHTDIQVTVSTFADVRLLQMLYLKKTPLFDETVSYIYDKQLEEANHIVVTKIDLISEEELSDIKHFLQQQYADKTIIYINATDADSSTSWLHVLHHQTDKSTRLSSLQINYETYGAGEAMLAWLDEELELYSSYNNAREEVIKLTEIIYQKVQSHHLAIGHLKFLVDDTIKISYTATFQPIQSIEHNKSKSAKLLINARVQTTPEDLKILVNEAIEEIEQQSQSKVIINSLSFFKPGFPKPTHRITD